MLGAMTYFVVTCEHGPAWDDSRAMRQQAGWDEHAAFMDALVAEGFVVLGGPLGEGRRALLVVEATDQDDVVPGSGPIPGRPRGSSRSACSSHGRCGWTGPD